MNNTITKLKEEDGGVVAGERLRNFIAKHFQNIFV